MTQAKILTLDLETAPIQSYHWGLWDQNIGLNMIGTDWSILSYSAKWLHDDRTMYKDTFLQRNQRKDLSLLKTVRNLLNEDPPFTAHQNDFASGAAWEVRVGDPRGRSYGLIVEYRFE